MSNDRQPAPRLVVVGDASIDYFVRVPHIAGHDNKAIGALAGVYGGGMSANLAAAAAQQGVAVELITKTGAGPDTDAALAELRGLGVSTEHSLRDRRHPTWMCFVQLDPSGEKALTGADTGIKLPEIGEIDASVMAGAAIVAPLADDLEWAAAVAELARERGARVAVDLEPDAFEPDQPEFTRLLKLSDIVFLNAASAAKLAPGGSLDAAQRLVQLGAELVVASEGARGAFTLDRDGVVHRARLRTEVTAVDTTGAGDALAGAFLGALLAGTGVHDSLRRAVAQATHCVTAIGGRTYLSDSQRGERPDVQIMSTTERYPS
ncbi:carbohydrate kinase family protein [Streptomyces boninensis]|uniref:carbohydrate kinase family protein n=1 Tax=Streptomyces boninensis TaxID=2039455 RepID=UPI003B213DD5